MNEVKNLRMPIGINIGLLLLRVVAGGFMLPHGMGKLFGWFGGPGLAGFALELKHFSLPYFMPVPQLLASAQTILGILVLIGAWTRLSAFFASLFLAMTALLCSPSGWFWMHGGMEYPLQWAAILFSVSLIGAGQISVDHYLRFSRETR